MISSDFNTAVRFFCLLQRIFVVVILSIIYFMFVGLCYIFALIFRRRIIIKRYQDSSSYWEDALGYDPDMEDCLRQS